MTRSHRPALGVALVFAATAAALPIPRPDEPPLPDGAVRRFGRADPPPKKRPEPDSDVRNLIVENTSLTGSAIAQTPDGKQIVVADRTGRIDLFDLATGRLARRLQAPGAEGTHVATVSPDGRWLACGRLRGDVQLWDLSTGKVAHTIPVRPWTDRDGRGQVERIVFGPDSKALYTGVEYTSSVGNRGATAWEVPSGKRLWNVPVVGYNLNADPRGRWVLTGLIQEEPPRLGLFDAGTGQLVRSMVIEPSWDADGNMLDASWTLDRMFTPDGSKVVTLHGDGTVRVWDPEAGKEVLRMKWGAGRTSEPGGLAGSPDGRWVAVRDGRNVQVWELASGRLAYTVSGLEAPPRELSFTRDGRGLVTSSGSAPVLWPLRPSRLPAADAPADELWAALGADDARAAYPLVWALSENPKAAVGLFAARIRPADLVLARDRFDHLVAVLDHPRYADRERAEVELTRAGMAAPVAWLRKALADSKSEEVRARLRRVLEAREKPGPARWRLDRAVQVLEMAGTAEAKVLLKEWAAGPAGGYLTDEAAGAVRRVEARK